MKLNTAIRYAVRILFALSCSQSPSSIYTLSERTGIAPRAIELTHEKLKQHGITTGVVGAKGGIALVLPLADISLGGLVAIFDGGVEFFICSGDRTNACPDMSECSMRTAWDEVSERVQDVLNALSLEEIFRNYEKNPQKNMRKAKCV